MAELATHIGCQNAVAELALNLVCLTLIHSMPSFSNIFWMGSSCASTNTLLESSMSTFMDSHFEPIQRGWLSGITGLGTCTTCHRRRSHMTNTLPVLMSCDVMAIWLCTEDNLRGLRGYYKLPKNHKQRVSTTQSMHQKLSVHDPSTSLQNFSITQTALLKCHIKFCTFAV